MMLMRLWPVAPMTKPMNAEAATSKAILRLDIVTPYQNNLGQFS
jgi:hypothetical protein